jgi:hypothetical protein
MQQQRNVLVAGAVVAGFVALLTCGCGNQPEPQKKAKHVKPRAKDETIKLEVKLTTQGRALKYWVSSEGSSGGDVVWRLPTKDVVVEVNLKKGEVSLSLTRWPLAKVTANKDGIVKISFTPAVKAGKGAIGLGMNVELFRVDAGKVLGLKRDATGSLARGLLLYDQTGPLGKGRLSFDPVVPKTETPFSTRPGRDRGKKGALGTFFLDEKGKVRFRRDSPGPK